MIGGVELMEMKGAAMSELYKAMKRIEDYQSTKPLYKQIAEIKGIASTARYGYDIQPQLTIPESIADELDKYDFELTSKGLMYRNIGGTLVEFSRVTYDEIPQLIVQTIAGNYRIVFAYLAGKALGVDLVKVTED